MVLINFTLSIEYNNRIESIFKRNAFGLMNFKTKEMHYGGRINSSFCFDHRQVRSLFR
jgi:hypothetical protein